MMEYLILGIGAVAFWLIHGRHMGEEKPPMTQEEIRYWTSGKHSEGAEMTKVLLTLAVLTVALSWAGAYGLLAAAVVTVILYWPD